MQFNTAQQTGSSDNFPHERLVARYVHSGNSVVQASSVNLSTGAFTTTQPMSWTAGHIYSDIIVSYNGGIPSKLFSEWNGIYSCGLQVIDANTFYIVNGSSGNSIYTYGSTESIDLTKIQFEYGPVAPPSIDLTKIKVGNKLRIVWNGIKNRPGYICVNPSWSYSGGSSSFITNQLDGRCFQIARLELICEYTPEIQLLNIFDGRTVSQQWGGGTNWSLSSSMGSERVFYQQGNVKFTSVGLGLVGGMSNGSICEVYTIY